MQIRDIHKLAKFILCLFLMEIILNLDNNYAIWRTVYDIGNTCIARVCLANVQTKLVVCFVGFFFIVCLHVSCVQCFALKRRSHTHTHTHVCWLLVIL